MRWRHLAYAVVAASLLAHFLLPGARTAAADTVPATGPVSITGEGSWDVTADMLNWQNDLYGSGSNPDINFNYVAQGGPSGLADLLSGAVQYAISGMPYTSEELAGYSGGAKGIIAAPIMASAVGFLLNPPPGGFTIKSGFDGSLSAPYTGQVRVPADNLVAQMFSSIVGLEQMKTTDPNYQYDPYRAGSPATSVLWGEWDNPDIIGNWDQSFLSQYHPVPDPNGTGDLGDIFEPSGEGPQPDYQAENNESTFYAEDWASVAAPNMWSMLQQVADPHPSSSNPWQPEGQVQPSLQKGLVFDAGLPESLSSFVAGKTFGGGLDTGGAIGAFPPSALAQATVTAQKQIPNYRPPGPGSGFEWVSVQNANGDWVTPSPASIETAVDATPTTTPNATTIAPPLYAANNKVPNAYPLTYVDYLYAPAHGLNVGQTEALATAVRYLVTDGQGYLASNNEGRLPAGMTLQALAAANQIVQSNCPSADTVLTATAGPYTPSGLRGLNGLGAMYHCEVPASTAPSATSTAVRGAGSASLGSKFALPGSAGGLLTPTGAAASAGPLMAGLGGGGPGATSAPGGTGLLGGRHSGKHASALFATAMPYSWISNPSSGLDHLAALVLGGWLFFLLRGPAGRWLKKLVGA